MGVLKNLRPSIRIELRRRIDWVGVGRGSTHAQCTSGGDVMSNYVEGENSETKAEKDVD